MEVTVGGNPQVSTDGGGRLPDVCMASGMSFLAVGAVWLVLGRAACMAVQGNAWEPLRDCVAFVEVWKRGDVLLECADAAVLGRCGHEIRAGDRVFLDEGGCRIQPSGMPALARLAVGLPILVNRASAQDLCALEGIGPHKAAAIVSDRRARGDFETVEQLLRVRGIGPATLERLRPWLAVATEPAPVDSALPPWDAKLPSLDAGQHSRHSVCRETGLGTLRCNEPEATTLGREGQ